MKVHLVAADMRPFVQAAGGVRSERERAHGIVFRQTQKARARRRGADGSDQARGAKYARHVLRDERLPQTAHHLIAHDSG